MKIKNAPLSCLFTLFLINICPMLNYFDHAATSPMSAKAIESYVRAAHDFPLNPSSIHTGGILAHKALEESRKKVSSILGIREDEVIFTSGATEAISMVFSSLLWQKNPGRVLISRVEHDAVKSFIPLLKEKGWDVVILRAKKGFVNPEDVRNALNENTRLVSVMNVNSVNGAIEDIPAIASVIREYEKSIKHKILFFSDSVQALAKTDLDLEGSGVDAASFSAHKIKGPRGVGMLYLRNRNAIRPLAGAGGQEGGLRGGTENLASIISFASALEDAYEKREEKEKRVRKLSERIKENILETGLELNSEGNVSPYIINISTPLPSEVFTRMLDDRGFAISSGSACSNNAKKGENIIEAMGYGNKRARSSVRISLSDETEEDEVEALIKAIKEITRGI